jgi:hypothetical protein
MASGLVEEAAAVSARAERAASEVLQTAKPGFVTYSRIGYTARGIVQVLVGGLALAAALGERGGRVTDAAGALRALGTESYGRPLLLLLAAGLIGYASLRLVTGAFDPGRRARTLRMGLTRTGEVLSGLGYLLLAWGAVRLAVGTGAPPTSDARVRGLSQQAMELPFGAVLVGAAALIFAGSGIWFLVRAFLVEDVCADLDRDQLGARGCRVAAFFIRLGSAAQGVLFGAVGYLLFRAAERQNPAEARGMDGALRLLERYGESLLGLMAVGLLALGVSAFIEARWRRLF